MAPERRAVPMAEVVDDVARRLAELPLKLVLVESCTAGLAAAMLGAVPGVSNVFCGSLVVYRGASKQSWLGVDPLRLGEPDGVGPRTSEALARAALARTPEADVSAAITGHLGPEAPQGLDGAVFCRVEFAPRRAASRSGRGAPRHAPAEARLVLKARSRRPRQQEAALRLLELLQAQLRTLAASDRDRHDAGQPSSRGRAPRTRRTS